MDEMGRDRPFRLQKHTTRHGQTAWYVRLKGGALTRIRGEYGSEEFEANYHAAIAGAPQPKAKPNSNSLQWLYDRYRESMAWSKLSAATRRQRENILAHVMTKAGQEAFKAIDGAAVVAGLDDRRETPSQARNYLDAVTGLFRWAKANNHVAIDPTRGVDRPQRLRGSTGFPVWTEGDVAAYREKWPLGTRQRVWLEVLLGTGLRRGDAVQAGRIHIKNGLFSLATEKTGMVMHCVIEPDLQAALDAGPLGRFHFICGVKGEGLVKEAFGTMFREACRAAGVVKSAHGLRKLAATIDAERGYTERELEAKYGWTGGFMASLYTKSANRKRLVIEAARRSMVLPNNGRVLPPKSDNEMNDLVGKKLGLVRSRKVGP